MAKKSVKKKSKVLKNSVIEKRSGILKKNLILFAILFVISLVLYSASTNPIYTDLFIILMIIFGFVGIAFVIALLVFYFLKYFK